MLCLAARIGAGLDNIVSKAERVAGYSAALAASVSLTGQGSNWLVSVTNVTGFLLSGILFGYQSDIAHHLQRQTDIAAHYRQALEERTAHLEQANRDLDAVQRFSQTIGNGTNSSAVFRRALAYIGTIVGVTRAAIVCMVPAESGQGDSLLWMGAEGGLLTRAMCDILRTEPTVTFPGVHLAHVRNAGEVVALLAVETSEMRLISLLDIFADQIGRTMQSLTTARTLATQAERVRLAMDMHDSIVQSLFGLGYSLDACVQMLPHRPDATRTKLTELRTASFTILAQLRAVIADLWHSQPTDDLSALSVLTLASLTNLIELHLATRTDAFPIQYSQSLREPQLLLPSQTVKAIYYATQEAIANAAKHAAPTQVSVIVTDAPNTATVTVTITDDGRGFDPHAAQPHHTRHFGLATMQRRIADVNGTLQIASAPGAGTTIAVTVPVPNQDMQGETRDDR